MTPYCPVCGSINIRREGVHKRNAVAYRCLEPICGHFGRASTFTAQHAESDLEPRRANTAWRGRVSSSHDGDGAYNED